MRGGAWWVVGAVCWGSGCQPGAAAGDAGLATVADAGPRSVLPFPPAGPDAGPDPALPGPYPVGVRTITFVDPSRRTPGRTAPRTLVCEVWYPADEAARGATETYVLHDHLPDNLKATIPAEVLGTFVTQAKRDAAPASEGAPYPFILFSHGMGGIRAQSTYYTVTLASHGYVVLAPDHEGDTLVDVLNGSELNLSTTLDKYLDRQADGVFLLDTWSSLPAADPLRAISDMNRVGVTGHSFGALTSLKVAGLDPRPKAVVAQTPAGYTITQADIPTPLEQYGIPIMLQAADMDRTLPPDPHTLSVWEHLSPPRYLLRLIRGGHFTYSDLCVLDIEALDRVLAQDISNVLGDGCGSANIPPSLAFPIINRSAIGFFNRHLRGSVPSERYLTAAALAGSTTGELTFHADP